MNDRRRIELLDNDSLHESLLNLRAGEEPLAVLYITRREIEAMNVGSTVDRLMTMSDTRANVLRLKNSLHLAVDGWNSDPRELYEIPEVTRFFRAVANQWNGWLHFVDCEDDTLPLLIRLLTDVRRVSESGGLVGACFIDPTQAMKCARHLFAGLNALYESYGFGEAAIAARTAEVAAVLDRMFAE